MDDGANAFALPSNPFDLRGEWGRSDFDRRHRLNFAGIMRIPRQFKFGLIGQVSSGIPFNVTSGVDLNGDGIVADRPFGFARNTGAGPGFFQLDARLSRRFLLVNTEASGKKASSAPYAEFRLDAFNIFNTVNAKQYVGVIGSPLFGRANSALPARQMQASVKFSF
jgi:hypothetical protein